MLKNEIEDLQLEISSLKEANKKVEADLVVSQEENEKLKETIKERDESLIEKDEEVERYAAVVKNGITCL